MRSTVSYELDSGIATIAMDDGKVNALSLQVLADLGRAFEQARADGATVLLTGRDGVFSGGFDLAVLGAGGQAGVDLVRAGFELAAAVLAHPRPVVVGCTGHAVAMGAFLMLSGDYRVGAAGPYKITANEVAIGMTFPRAAVEVVRQRVSPAYLTRTILLAEPFAPEAAVTAGLLDQVVPADEVAATARRVAGEATAALHAGAFMASKEHFREPTLRALRTAIGDDYAELSRRAAEAAAG